MGGEAPPGRLEIRVERVDQRDADGAAQLEPRQGTSYHGRNGGSPPIPGQGSKNSGRELVIGLLAREPEGVASRAREPMPNEMVRALGRRDLHPPSDREEVAEVPGVSSIRSAFHEVADQMGIHVERMHAEDLTPEEALIPRRTGVDPHRVEGEVAAEKQCSMEVDRHRQRRMLEHASGFVS